MRVPEYSAASEASMPTDIPLRIRLRIRRFWSRNRPQRKLRKEHGPPKGKNLLRQKRIFSGTNHVNARAKYRDGFPSCYDRAAMADVVDAPSHAADTRQIPVPSGSVSEAGRPLSRCRSVPSVSAPSLAPGPASARWRAFQNYGLWGGLGTRQASTPFSLTGGTVVIRGV